MHIGHRHGRTALEISVLIAVQIGVTSGTRYREIRCMPWDVIMDSSAISQPINPVLIITGAYLHHDAEVIAGFQHTARVTSIQIACADSAYRNPFARPDSIARTVDDAESRNESARASEVDPREIIQIFHAQGTALCTTSTQQTPPYMC